MPDRPAQHDPTPDAPEPHALSDSLKALYAPTAADRAAPSHLTAALDNRITAMIQQEMLQSSDQTAARPASPTLRLTHASESPPNIRVLPLWRRSWPRAFAACLALGLTAGITWFALSPTSATHTPTLLGSAKPASTTRADAKDRKTDGYGSNEAPPATPASAGVSNRAPAKEVDTSDQLSTLATATGDAAWADYIGATESLARTSDMEKKKQEAPTSRFSAAAVALGKQVADGHADIVSAQRLAILLSRGETITRDTLGLGTGPADQSDIRALAQRAVTLTPKGSARVDDPAFWLVDAGAAFIELEDVREEAGQ